MHAAKWIKLPVLLSLSEMRALVEATAPFRQFQVGSVVASGEAEMSHETFLTHYSTYLEQVRAGFSPYTRPFALIWTKSESTLARQILPGGREIIRPQEPSIQLQPHHFQFDQTELACRSMVYGIDSIPWGLQFSYPHLFEDPKTHVIETVDERFINTELFQTIRQFIRDQTRPTPLCVKGQKVNIPIRLGKECFDWIGQYQWLQHQGIDVIR